MTTDIAVALIGIAGGILSAVAGQIPIKSALSQWTRRRSGVPEIMLTKWQAEWKYDDGSPTVNDRVTFASWTKDNQFKGFGEVIHDGTQYIYQVAGEVSPTRIVAFTYRAERYPTEAYFGVACLQLSADALKLSGNWVGFEGGLKQAGGPEALELHAGKVTMKRIEELDHQ
jgi:hypothetical protein